MFDGIETKGGGRGAGLGLVAALRHRARRSGFMLQGVARRAALFGPFCRVGKKDRSNIFNDYRSIIKPYAIAAIMRYTPNGAKV